MPGNTFGHTFRITTWGESHGKAIGVVVDGCPAGLKLSEQDIQHELDRRKPGQSPITSQRKEADVATILSGVFEGRTIGTPISMLIWNRDAHGQDYENIKTVYRPSHADYTYDMKYGVRNWMGGGRASARETVARSAAGAIAKKILSEVCNGEIVAWVSRLGHDLIAHVNPKDVTRADVEKNIVRCPDLKIGRKMIDMIEKIRSNGDSIGGVISCVARNIPAGLGDPVFDKLHADLAQGLCSLPAVRAFEIGSGFESLMMKGSQHNDPFIIRKGEIRTKKNDSGGIQGGISNGEYILVHVTFKPVATILQKQKTVTQHAEKVAFTAAGRHDPCVLPRAVPLVEAMMSLVLCDHLLRTRTNKLEDILKNITTKLYLPTD